MKISLIIPVYKAERTLPATLESVRNQAFCDFEVIFVEDNGGDGSLALLEAFCRDSGLACKLVRQDCNQGAAAARNRALELAEGEYLAFADADDLLDPAMLEHAAAAAQTPDGPADIVGWDWTLKKEQGERYMRQPDYESPEKALLQMTGGASRWNLWLYLIRRSLVEDGGIRFIDGADMGEDMQFILRCFLRAKKVVQLHASLYCWNAANSSSISRSFAPEKRAQIERNLAAFAQDFAASDFAKAHPSALDDLKLYLKRPLLISTRRADYETWYHWFPEANARASAAAFLPGHTRILQGMAARRCWVGVRLYYVLVHKLLYPFLMR